LVGHDFVRYSNSLHLLYHGVKLDFWWNIAKDACWELLIYWKLELYSMPYTFYIGKVE
jgi:hypothetical protein